MTEEQDKYFIRGFGLGISMLAKESKDYSLAKRLLSDSGFSIEDFKRAKIDNFDMDELKKIYKEG